MQKTDNRTTGGKFEQVMSSMLADHGFWSHVLQQNKSGQPADIIAVKGKYHTLIDCKVISDHDGFPLSRVEENQRLAMKRFMERGGECGWFALKLPDDTVWMVSITTIGFIEKQGVKSIPEKLIREKLWSVEEWLKAADEWSKDI